MVLAKVAMHMSAATRDKVSSSKCHILWRHALIFRLAYKLLRHPRLALAITHASHQRITSAHILFSLNDQLRYWGNVRFMAKKATRPANVRQRRTMHAGHHPHFLPFAFCLSGAFFIAMPRLANFLSLA